MSSVLTHISFGEFSFFSSYESTKIDTFKLSSGRRSLFHTLVKALRSQNIKEVYEDDAFKVKLTYKEVMNNLKGLKITPGGINQLNDQLIEIKLSEDGSIDRNYIYTLIDEGFLDRQFVEEPEITAQEIEGFLATEEAIAQLTPELLVRQIQVGSLEAAETILSRLEEGENFEALVEEKSINQNKSQGGLMPWRKINEMPSVFADAIRNQSLGFISEPIKTGSGFHLLKLEEKRGPLVKFEEQWETRHVLLIPSAIRDVDATKAEAEVLRERVLAGEDFALIAEEFSEDPGSASNGGNLEWLPKGATVGEFENVMVNSEINEVSEVFESQFGFHFLEVTGKRVEDVTDYQIEERAYSVLFSRKYDEELENTLRSMRAEAFVEFKDLD